MKQSVDYQKALVAMIADTFGQSRVLIIHRPMIDFTGSIEAALLLEQCLYWGSGRSALQNGWFAHTMEQWEEELSLRRFSLNTARTKLEKMGVLETSVLKWAGAPTLHWRIKWDALTEAYSSFCMKPTNGYVGNQQIDMLETNKSSHLLEPNKSLLHKQDDETEKTTRAQKGASGFSSLMGGDEGYSQLRSDLRTLAQCFDKASRHKITKSTVSKYRKQILLWRTAGVGEVDIIETVQYMREKNLTIGGPESLTKIMLDRKATRQTSLEEYPVFSASAVK